MDSTVNHPSHYNQEGKKECIVAMQEKYGRLLVYGFDVGNKYKYTYRAGEKINEPVCKDLSKAHWYDMHSFAVYGSWNWFQRLVYRLACKICF